MKLSTGALRDNLFCRFFSVSQRLNFIFAWNCLMFVPINSLSLSLSLSDLGRVQKSLETPYLAILAQAVEVFFKIHYCLK